ncbi:MULTISPECIES: chloride channel protein [Nostoc]|uniref:Chloride channel protein n=1 Tax=Nostoc paludosum FACHB-159 TaxID=2692908 RepID=A0ABR8KE10_9NOSO|nr:MULTISPECIES: chloride channel protein [Nostoc]MBD2681317.1 chloride channel protein [Nostoc sp. FACHB-857]MBD2737796.1 chloride channel protein [Nostoc paludosum FACHB-159]
MNIKTSESSRKKTSFSRLLVYAACLGVGIGCLSSVYYFTLQLGTKTIWTILPNVLGTKDFYSFAWIITAIAGLLVGLTVRYLGAPGGLNVAIDEIHREGRIDYRQTLGMVVASWLSLVFGSSAGPEAPLLDINGGIGSWVADKLKLAKDETRILTFCGISAALGAFFGSPLGSALLALELPHRLGLEYYEALIPVIVSAIGGFAVFRLATGLTIGGFYEFPAYDKLHPDHLIYAVLLGVIGAGLAVLFILIFRFTQRLINSFCIRPILLTTLGGFGIGLIAIVLPLTLFYGERQIQTIIDQGRQLGAGLLLLTALGKMFTVSLSLHTGFRGGVLFPLFFIGAAVGMAISLLIPAIPPTVAMVCIMAALTVAVMKTPVSIALILAIISDTDLIPVTTVAAITSFLLTTHISLISTQRSRQPML